MAAIASSLLLAAFGGQAKEIAEIVRLFDFGSVDISDSTTHNYLHTDLAPSYGTLNGENLKRLDDNLKIMIAGTMKLLSVQKNHSWPAVLATMMQNPLLEQDDAAIDRADVVIKNDEHAFKFDGSPNAQIVREIETWFTKLINDADIIMSTRIDITVLAKIVAQSGATITSFLNFFAKHEKHSKEVVDIGVLRFPDIDTPHFKLYRIQLVAWSDCSRILFRQEDKNGITGEFNCRTFKPRKSVIDGLSEQTRKDAIEEAEALFL